VPFEIAVAQSIVETAFYTSAWWWGRGNPAGLGITGDPAQDAASPLFMVGSLAARAQIAHLLLYATGRIDRGGLSPVDDPRFAAYRDAHGARAIAPTLAGLAGRWAADPTYSDQIAARAADLIATPIPGGPPVPDALTMTRDLIPLPDFEKRIITDAENDKWNALGKREVRGFVLHRQLGTLDGTDGWFRRGKASTGLTDWGQDNGSRRIYLWNSPEGFASPGASPDKSPWASGEFNKHGDAYGDGLAFVAKYGINAVNQLETAWEIAGNYNDPWPIEDQRDAAQACAHYAHNYGIRWDQFPIHPQDGFSFVRWHQEICGPAEKICPGPVVMAATPAWIEMVRAIMKTAQTAAASPLPPAPAPAQPKYAPRHPVKSASARTAPYNKRLALRRDQPGLEYADPHARPTGPAAKKGALVNLSWVTIGSDNAIWFVTSGGSRMPASAFFDETGGQK
jgi:hypothetical protein